MENPVPKHIDGLVIGRDPVRDHLMPLKDLMQYNAVGKPAEPMPSTILAVLRGTGFK